MHIFKKKSRIILSYVLITFGIASYTFAWSTLMLPSKIVGGGVSGMSSVLYYALGLHLPIGVMNLIINAILVIIGFKVLGSKFGANTIYGIIASSLFFILWQQVLGFGMRPNWPFDVTQFGGFMCAIIGGAVCGAGIGLTFAMGGNSGGTDIIALILSKYYNISPGKVIMYLDIIIIGSSYFVSGKIENVVFGYVVMVTMTYVLDMVLDGNRQSYQILVFSQKNKEISDAITKEIGRGVTLLDGEGGFSHQQQQVLIVMVHKTDKPNVMQLIHRIDDNAFISVSKTQGVYGRNFDKLKM
ncbi:MAG: YitT family protein [Bacteroidales bacterium]|nr:YitT family protein [Bacteroidales bacterium]